MRPETNEERATHRVTNPLLLSNGFRVVGEKRDDVAQLALNLGDL